MPGSSIISVLHISDFHHSKRKARDQSIVVDALVADLEALCIGHRQPDLVVFTGDLVNAAGEDSHFEAYDVFVGRVATATRCSDERIFIVPGNHDAERVKIKQLEKEHRAWRAASDVASVNKLFENGDLEPAGQKFESFHDLENILSASSRVFQNAFITVHRVEALNVEIVIINTALFSTAGLEGSGSDLGKLAVSEFAVLDALRCLTAGSFRIFATHHPLSWLSESSAKFLRSAIQKHGAMHLFGHMHEPLTTNATSYEGELYSDQAGAIFAGRQRYIGYSLISVDTGNRFYETHLRSFFKDRSQFDEARDVVPNGRFYSSQAAREFWRGIATPVDDRAFRDHLKKECLAELLRDSEHTGIGDRNVHNLFVPAPMTRNVIQQSQSDQPDTILEEHVTFDELVRNETNCIIYASPEFGRTTVLLELRYHLLKEAEELTFPRMPVLVDFGDVSQNVGRLFRTVRSRSLSSTEEFDFESLLKLGHVCVLVDDVEFGDAKRMAILRAFITKYPKARYVLSSLKASAAPYGATVDPETPVQFDLVELCAYRRRDMRLLLTKWSGCTDVDTILDRIQQEIGEINLPFTAANGTILMVIFEEQSGFRPINRSVLVEQFVDINLKKGSIEQSQRETFDYHNKTALLAHIAGWMARNDCYVPETEKLREVVSSYVSGIEVNVGISSLLDEFMSSRILLARPDNRVSFRHRAVLEYFIALQMRKDPAFKDWVLHEKRYLSFSNEIQYFAGSARNDTALLEEMGRRFETIMGEIEGLAGGIDLNRIAALELPVDDEDGFSVERLAEQLSDTPLPAEERDAELETDIPKDAEDRQEVLRPVIEEDGHRFLAALLLYSGLIKNMEEAPGSDKRRHLDAAWRGWGMFLQLSLLIVPELAIKRRMRINGVLYEIAAPRGLSNSALARRISLGMPVGITKLVGASLGTEKLERQLTEPQFDDEEEPLVVDFFRSSLIADLKLPSTVTALGNTLRRLGPSRYLLEAMICKIAELRRYNRIPERRFKKVSPAVATAIATLGGARGKALTSEKGKQMRRLERQGVMLKLRKRDESE